MPYDAPTEDEGHPPIWSIMSDDFDTRANQQADGGQHHRQLSKVDDILIGFQMGLKDSWKDTVILTLTEFGRTVKVNGSTGTDHGYGSAGLLAGGLLKGGNIISQWPERKEVRCQKILGRHSFVLCR